MRVGCAMHSVSKVKATGARRRPFLTLCGFSPKRHKSYSKTLMPRRLHLLFHQSIFIQSCGISVERLQVIGLSPEAPWDLRQSPS